MVGQRQAPFGTAGARPPHPATVVPSKKAKPGSAAPIVQRMEGARASQSVSPARPAPPDLELFRTKHIYELQRGEAIDAALIERVIRQAAARTQDRNKSIYGSTILVLSPLEAHILELENAERRLKNDALPFSFGITVLAPEEKEDWGVFYVPPGTYAVDFSLARGKNSKNTIDHLANPEQYRQNSQFIGTVPRLSRKGALEDPDAKFTPVPGVHHQRQFIPLRPFSFGGRRRHSFFDQGPSGS